MTACLPEGEQGGNAAHNNRLRPENIPWNCLGVYDLGGQDVTVRGNLATLADGTIAGSATDLAACLRWAVREADIPLESAVKAATANPARAIGVDAERGAIEPGKVADAVLLDAETLDVRHVVLRGRLLA